MKSLAHTLSHKLLRRPVWLYASVSALAVVLMAAISSLFAPQLQQWEERLASRTWAMADSSAVICVHPREPANNSFTLALNPLAIDMPSSFL